jgi:hypothetical protein
VQAIQACANGAGLTSAQFSVFALLLIGAAGCLAGAKLFRWDAQQRFATAPGKAWVGVALAAWVAVGVLADADGRAPRPTATSAENVAAPPVSVPAPAAPPSAEVLPPKEVLPP